MPLALNVRKGGKVYVGRDMEVSIGRVTKTGAEVVVFRRTGERGVASFNAFMEFGQDWEVNRGEVTVRLGRRWTTGSVTVFIQAPHHMVVSRDEFTLESHLSRQRQRELEGSP